MPYKVVPSRSDRGSIKDIQKKVTDYLEENPDMPPTSQELRIKALYERAVVLRDQALIDSLGLIVMNGAVNDPVSVMRHREYVKGIADKCGLNLEKTKLELEILVAESPYKSLEMRVASYKQKNATNIILAENGLFLKNASDESGRGDGPIKRSFWRTQ